MVMGRSIQVRMTKDQYERIKNISAIKGFNSLSSYLRFVALDQDLFIQQKVLEIHRHSSASRLAASPEKTSLPATTLQPGFNG